ncbi:hypothetical protein QWY74_01500, partial [Halomonas almeriensis]|uniref:hypothetical protein n=1 Tax=Halomonas almeriensis TaxID=308163 RepID=UPI0025B49E9E
HQRLARKAYSTASLPCVKLDVTGERRASKGGFDRARGPAVASGEHFTGNGVTVNRRFFQKSEKPQSKQ